MKPAFVIMLVIVGLILLLAANHLQRTTIVLMQSVEKDQERIPQDEP